MDIHERSQAYSLFRGIGETLGGVLLVLPALTTLGALVSLAMMTNVLMLNMFYDVPRKSSRSTSY